LKRLNISFDMECSGESLNFKTFQENSRPEIKGHGGPIMRYWTLMPKADQADV
jgi:hypothetical protein